MKLSDEILESVRRRPLSYKGVRAGLYGLPQFKNRSYGTLRTTLHRLHKKGLVSGEDKNWHLTEAGKAYMKKKADILQQFTSPYVKNPQKNLLVLFDIPETRKAEREWFRFQLKKFGYSMIQKSVWVGPSPLSKEFVTYVKKIKLENSIKTFKLAKSYTGT